MFIPGWIQIQYIIFDQVGSEFGYMNHFGGFGIMEGVTFGMKDSLKIFQNMGLSVQELRCSGGGAKSSTWRQIQADIYKQPVVQTNIEEDAAFGAALLAGIGTEIFSISPEEICERSINITNTINPKNENLTTYEELYERFRALYQVLKPEFQSLSEIEG